MKDFTVEFDDSGYNIGRLLLLEYNKKIFYISLSEIDIKSRNSSFQSFPSALNRFILEKNRNKEICYYFHPDISGSYETAYFVFMYRLMKTAKVNFLNSNQYLKSHISSFSSPQDIILSKNNIRGKNQANKSTYITRGERNEIQIFGKTYGANKYETTILCHALSEVTKVPISLFEIEEGGLTKLPQKSKDAIESLEKVKIFSTNKTIERESLKESLSLRSPTYIYNLLEKLGEKSCSLCSCEIPQIIQGAHVWPVSSIKKLHKLTDGEKLDHATNGDNGLWLCQNHHKLFDSNIICIDKSGNVLISDNIDTKNVTFLSSITTTKKLSNKILNKSFMSYLAKRNSDTDLKLYKSVS